MMLNKRSYNQRNYKYAAVDEGKGMQTRHAKNILLKATCMCTCFINH